MILNSYAYAALSYPSPSFSGYVEDNAPGSATVTLSSYSYGYGNNVIGIYEGNTTISSVTLDGTSATQRVEVGHDSQRLQLWDVTKGSAGSGSIVIVHGATPLRCAAGLWIVGNSSFVSASGVSDTDNSEIIDLSTTLTANDHLIGLGYLRDNTYTVGGMTVVGFTKDWDEETDSTRWFFGGHIFSAAGGSTTAQFDTNEAPPQFAACGIAGIWRPV